MKIKFLGHASFLITSDSGVTIITDPYMVGGPLTYKPINESADVVLVSHGHGDHNNVSAVKGKPTVIGATGTTTAKSMTFKGVPTFHDQYQGRERGKNIVFCFSVDGVKICHTGDLGHGLTPQQAAEVGQVDVLLLVVGGIYAIGPEDATRLMQQLDPRVTIPMHYKNARCGYPIAPVDDFLKGKRNVRKTDACELALKADNLPNGEIVVLKPSKE